MTLTLLTLILAVAFPSSTQTSWMSPQSFHLTVGMSRADAVKKLAEGGWEAKRGKHDDELVVDYSDSRALTLEFKKNRLHSLRFELFAMLPEIRTAFDEQKGLLRKAHGEPKKGLRSDSVVLYDDRLPNIMVVVSADPSSEYGQKGFGFLAVRYFDPVTQSER